MKKQRGKKRRIISLVILFVELVILICLFAGYYIISKWELVEQVVVEDQQVSVNEGIDKKYVTEMSKGYLNFVIFGVDEGGINSDVNLLVSINRDNGEINIVSLYRDTYLKMTDGTFDKVNSAICINGPLDAMNVINTNLDIKLENFVVVDWKAMAIAVDVLGGLYIDIPENMLYYVNSYLTFVNESTGMWNPQLDSAGRQLLHGTQVVAYCRIRNTDSDLARTARQRAVVEQMIERAKQMPLSKINELANLVFPMIKTSFKLDEVFSLIPELSSYKIANATGFPFYMQSVADFRYKEWYPLFATDLSLNVRELHAFLYGKRDYEVSNVVKTISEYIEEETGLSAVPSTLESAEWYGRVGRSEEENN